MLLFLRASIATIIFIEMAPLFVFGAYAVVTCIAIPAAANGCNLSVMSSMFYMYLASDDA
jgi:hypothetical protein